MLIVFLPCPNLITYIEKPVKIAATQYILRAKYYILLYRKV